MTVTINIYEGKCTRPEPRIMEEAGPPIDETVCVPKPPASGNWHLNAVNGVVVQPPTWLQD